MENAQVVASSIVKSELRNGVFAKTIWNKNKTAQNQEYRFLSDVTSLELSRVFILTSGYTRGAAEWLIHSLQAVMGFDHVILIGEKTAGQNVLNGVIRSDEYMISIYPSVAYVSDANDNYDYASGITPTYEIREREYLHLYPYGDSREVLFNKALEIMSNSF